MMAERPANFPFNQQTQAQLSWSVTNVPTETLTHIWTIENYACLDLLDVKSLDSPVFSSGSETDVCKWKLRLYPKGNKPETEEYVGVHLILLEPEGKVGMYFPTFFQISVLNGEGQGTEFHSDHYCRFTVDDAFGPEKLVSYRDLGRHHKDLLSNSNFVVQVKIIYGTGEERGVTSGKVGSADDSGFVAEEEIPEIVKKKMKLATSSQSQHEYNVNFVQKQEAV